MLGNESVLIERYGVSRAVLREAMRQLERQGIVRTQRGRNGGLVVALPVDNAVIRAIAGYLEATDTDLGAILEAQFFLEVQAAVLACERIDRAGIARLRALSAALPRPSGNPEADAPPHTELRAAIAEVAGNRVLALFVRALNLSSIELRTLLVGPPGADAYRERVERSIANKRALVEAIVGAEPGRVRQIIEQDRHAQMQLFASLRPPDQTGLDEGTVSDAISDQKLAHTVMLRIAKDVARAGHPPGARLGSEAEMLRRYGVGRAAFREALRVLEQHGVVRMRRGVGGGLFVGTPNLAAAAAMAARHFRHMGIQPSELRAVLAALLVDMVALAARSEAPFPESERSPATGEDPAATLGRWLAARSGNPVLELLTSVLTEAAPRSSGDCVRTDAVWEAIRSGDVPMARRAMKDLLTEEPR